VGAIRLDRLTKVHPGGHVAVDEVDLDIADGEFFVLLGPSGCGKTSVLRMIAGLDEPSAGDVLVDGCSVRDVRTRDRHVGMLFQSSAVYPHLTVRENLAFPLVVAKIGRREVERRVAEMAQLVGLTAVLDLRPRRLSGGMQQRVAMGRALMRRPPLLLMDEPMSNLDAKLRTELRGQLGALQRWSGSTTVYVTHDQVEAMALGDRAAVMRRGRVVQCGPPQELYRCPIDLFVATFVGMPPMNVVRARLGRDDGLTAEIGPHRLSLGDAGRWPGVDRHLGHDVALGIRPTGFTATGRPNRAALPVEVTRVEQVGVERLVTATLEAQGVAVTDWGAAAMDEMPVTITALLDHQVDVDLWRPIHLEVDVDEIHLFDLPTGRRIATTDRVGSPR
jgi:multiple sugar transport system ATP-binding protein